MSAVFKKKSPALYGLMASVFIHGFVLSAFIFTVPLIRQSFKPQFVFLGKILKTYEVTNPVKKKISPSDRKDSYFPKEAVAVSKKGQENAPDLTYDKPPLSVSKLEKTNTKKLFKAYIETPDFAEENRHKFLKELGVKLEAQPYQPLSIKH